MSEEQPDPIRVCLLVDGETITEWQHVAIQRMIDETTADVTAVLSNQKQQDRTPIDLLKRGIELREWTLVWLARSLFADPQPLTNSVDLNGCSYVDDAMRLDCVPETVDEWKNDIPTSAAKRAASEADVAVRFGFGFVVGEILTSFDHGVLSFHHGDLRKYRGQPAGCWEFIHGETQAGITLQRLTDQLDAGEVVEMKTVRIDDVETYSEIRERLFASSEDMLATAVRKLEEGDTTFETVDDLGPLYTTPSGFDALRFFSKELRGHARRAWQS